MLCWKYSTQMKMWSNNWYPFTSLNHNLMPFNPFTWFGLFKLQMSCLNRLPYQPKPKWNLNCFVILVTLYSIVFGCTFWDFYELYWHGPFQIHPCPSTTYSINRGSFFLNSWPCWLNQLTPHFHILQANLMPWLFMFIES